MSELTGPQVTTEHYYAVETGTWHGTARCRGGHQQPLPDPEFGTWCTQHALCEPETVTVPRAALDALVRVAGYVSLGRGAVDHQPDGAPYPDAAARRAVGILDDAGLWETYYA